MAKFTLNIDCNNSAFDDHPPAEIKRILGELSVSGSLDSATSGKLRDVNGNLVGAWRLTGGKR